MRREAPPTLGGEARFEVQRQVEVGAEQAFGDLGMRPRRGVTGRPKVSKTNAKYKEDYQDLIETRMTALRKASFTLRKSYVVNSGGFSGLLTLKGCQSLGEIVGWLGGVCGGTRRNG